MNSILIKLERAIGSIADRIRGGVDRAQAAVKNRITIAKFVKVTKQKFAPVIAFSRTCGLAIAASAYKMIRIAIHGASLPSIRKPTVPPLPLAIRYRQKKPTARRASGLEGFLISAWFGLVVICGLIILAVFLQLREMKADIARWEKELAATKTRLNQIEKVAQQQSTVKAQPAHLPLAFDEAEVKVIRQFIKVLPPKPGAQQKIQTGDEISNMALAPIPESLVDQLPKLRGARFSIDQDGAIIIIGAGSNRADVVIGYH